MAAIVKGINRKEKKAAEASADNLGPDGKRPQIEGGEHNIAGVLGEINYDLAIASAAYYQHRRDYVIDVRDRIPLSRKQEQDDYGDTVFEEKDYSGCLAEGSGWD